MSRNLQVPTIDEPSRDQSYRHSLQPRGAPDGPTLRHTRSQNYGAKKKKKVQVPPIPEVDVIDGEKDGRTSVEVINEEVRVQKHRHSRGSRKGSQVSKIGIDNAAFEIEDGAKMSRGGSVASSVRSSMRDPSVQSLTVVREQYCCCARWTPCERALFAAVCVLFFIVIILVVTVVLMTVHPEDDPSQNSTTNSFLPIFDFTNY